MDSQWLKTQFASNPGKTKTGLAAAIGVEPPAISKILNGTRQIKAQEYILMRKYFGLPVDGHAAVRKNIASYTVAAPLEREMLSDGAPPPPEWAIPGSIGAPQPESAGNIRIFQVRDTLMEPEFQRGEHVLVDIADRKPSLPGLFIVSDGFSNMLRHCEYVAKPGHTDIRVSARKDGFQAQILKAGEFLVVGRVIARLQMI